MIEINNDRYEYGKQYLDENMDYIIYRQEPLAATAGVINDESFYSLNVKDKNGIPIKIAYCDYLDDEWRVVIGGLDPARKKSN